MMWSTPHPHPSVSDSHWLTCLTHFISSAVTFSLTRLPSSTFIQLTSCDGGATPDTQQEHVVCWTDWEEAAALTLSLQGDQNTLQAPWDWVETLFSASVQEQRLLIWGRLLLEKYCYIRTHQCEKRNPLLICFHLPRSCALCLKQFKLYVCRRCASQQSWQKRDFLFSRRPRITCSASAHLPVWDERRCADFVFSAHFTAPMWTNQSNHVGLRNHCMALVYCASSVTQQDDKTVI